MHTPVATKPNFAFMPCGRRRGVGQGRTGPAVLAGPVARCRPGDTRGCGHGGGSGTRRRVTATLSLAGSGADGVIGLGVPIGTEDIAHANATWATGLGARITVGQPSAVTNDGR